MKGYLSGYRYSNGGVDYDPEVYASPADAVATMRSKYTDQQSTATEINLSADPRIRKLTENLRALVGAYYAGHETKRVARECLELLDDAPDLEYVGVVFKEFNSPAEAAAHGARGNATAPAPKDRVWSYGADPALKLTIGDRVIVPVGDSTSSWDEGEATVVRLNEKPYPYYSKNVIRRV